MNRDLFKEILNDLLQFDTDTKVNKSQLESVKINIQELKKNRDSISFKKNKQIIDLLAKYIEDLLKLVRRKRVNIEIDFQLKNDLKIYIEKQNALDKEDYKLNDNLQIDVESISSILENTIVPTRKISSEIELEKHLTIRLKEIYGNETVHRQYSVSGFLGLKTDFDVGNGMVGVEIKGADKL